ncbi:arginase family enzyme [Sphingomonas kaistensis]|uniref:Arginase family enzyme n=1 Tax=Sphingomonas kaistensis TaxID=298708 RepID=A0A7X5Y546_9SPHN|nr:arginase family protein [Sphingomonas kaistensis]NJC04727.1 arginase family enzyme [Sphingomonas kaistensis]
MTSAWPNLSDLLLATDAAAPIGLVGAPLGAGSVTPGRCDLAPARLRAVMKRIGLYDIDTGRELGSAIADHGDAAIGDLDIEAATGPIRSAVKDAVRRHSLTVLIGGNNAVTRPGVLGMAEALGLPLDKVGLITLDAHFDMRGLENGLSNGNPVRALIEDGLPGRNIVQIGLAPWANSREMHEFAQGEGAATVSLGNFHGMGVTWTVDHAFECLEHVEAILLDCDIDVIDRSQFPGAPGARAGGMSVHDFFKAVRLFAAHRKVRAIDLTEWDPPLDQTDLSALTAGRWLAEVVAGFESRA